MTRIILTVLLLSACIGAQVEEEPIMEITTTVDFGEDVGQNFGSLFEAKDAEGRVVFGAGFAGLYNTHFRMDRYTLQFFVRDEDSAPTFEKLPPPSDDGGTYLFDLDGRVHQFSHYEDRIVRWWDNGAGAWQVDDSFGHRVTNTGEGKMRVAGKLLQFKGGGAWYDDRQILTNPEIGRYHHFYYALGHLVFFHDSRESDPAYSRLYAVPWIPGSGPVDLSRAVTLDVKYSGETPFAIGQVGDQILDSSNVGGVYAFDGSQWKVVRPSKTGVSFQLYSMLNWYDKMLIGQYPTGNLFEYDGKELRHMEGEPPVMPGVSDRAREAQTTCIYGGDLYVGVWPWAELWRYDAHGDTWCFVKRMFETPEITDEMVHPWDDKVADYNNNHEDQIVGNLWGQRITGLNPMGDALYISLSAKGCNEREMRLEFLHDDEVWNQYRAVYRMRKPGCAVGAIAWTGKPTTLRFTVTEERISIEQDGQALASAPISAALAARVKEAQIEWAYGMFGPLRGTIESKAVQP